MKAVAKLAGVSTATVSRYINNSGYVGTASKVRIQAAIDDLNYSPNEVARSLQQKKSRLIGLLLPDMSNPFFTMMAKGIEDELNKTEYSLILANVQENKDKESEYLRSFKNNNVAGVISAIEHKTKLDREMPYVSIDRVSSNDEYSVTGDDYRGGEIAATEILKRNPKEILILNSIEHLEKSKNRLNGILTTLNKHDVIYYIHSVYTYRIDEVDGMMDTILINYPNVDSIIASNDLHALVLLKSAIQKNIAIPEKLQIIGYDNISFSALANPGLSTVAQPVYQMGVVAAQLLLNIIEKKPIEKKQIVLPVEFINRESLKDIKNTN